MKRATEPEQFTEVRMPMIVAGADRSIGPVIAHEIAFLRRHGQGVDLGGKRIVRSMTAHAEIVDMHMLSGRNDGSGNADGLAITNNLLAAWDVANCDLVPTGHGLEQWPVKIRQTRTGLKILKRYGNIVIGMEANGRIELSCHGQVRLYKRSKASNRASA
jgi:hypothetical protein